MPLGSLLPKRSRIAGLGIVTLARLSGRPIIPIAVVTRRRFDFNSWDRASLGKPFGRGAIVLGDLIRVAPDADDAALEVARRAVEAGLDTCAQEFWSQLPETVGGFLGLDDDHMLFAGMALGYRDDEAPINALRTRRAPFEAFAQMRGF